MAAGVYAVWLFIFFSTGFCQSKSSTHSLESRWTEIKTRSEDYNLLNFDASSFLRCVYFPKRNYSVLLLFTSKKNCQLCPTLMSEFEITARSWRRSPNHNYGLFIGYVDYGGDGRAVFRELGLAKAPMILYFEKESLHPETISLKRNNAMAEHLAKILSSSTPFKFEIRRPFDWVIGILVVITISLAAWFAFCRRDVLDDVCSVGSVCIVNLMTSGHIFNCIRGGQIMGNFQSGFALNQLVQPAKRLQYVIETPIVFVFMTIIGYGMIFLGFNNSLNVIKMKNVLVIGSISAILIGISVLSTMTRVKIHGYPYSFKF